MDSITASSPEREQRFREIFDAVYVDLLRLLLLSRRVHPTHAEDVVGDVMLVAWRRTTSRKTSRRRAPGSSVWHAYFRIPAS